jgi:hypothetical protein
MMDLFLFAANEADMTTALLLVGVIDDEGNPPVGISVDQIGPFVRNGIEYVDWHTNLRGTFTDEQLAALEPMRVNPTLPYRVFAG